MHESATLNTGQCGSSIQSTTCPRRKPGDRNSRSPRFPAAPAEQQPERDAQGTLRSRRAVRRMATMTPRAIRVKTTVTEVPMLNAAPLLRSSRSVSRPPSRRMGARSDRVATTMVLEIRSATKTTAATVISSRTRRGRGAGPGLSAAP